MQQVGLLPLCTTFRLPLWTSTQRQSLLAQRDSIEEATSLNDRPPRERCIFIIYTQGLRVFVLVSLIVFLIVSTIFRIVHPIPISPFIQIFALVIYFKYIRKTTCCFIQGILYTTLSRWSVVIAISFGAKTLCL